MFATNLLPFVFLLGKHNSGAYKNNYEGDHTVEDEAGSQEEKEKCVKYFGGNT
jgi:hypothetical protein